MSRSSTKDMFYQDLNDAFIHLIKFTLSPSVHDAKIHDVDWYICPPANLPLYGNCFCYDALKGYDHDYTTCNENLPYPSIISTNPDNHVDSVVKLCPYLDQRIPEDGVGHNHRLSCFKPVKSAEIFMNWFMNAPAERYDYTRWDLNKDEKRAIEDLVDDYEGWVPVNGARGSWSQKKLMLCRLMGCFLGKDIPDDAYHSPAQWEAQRLLEVLRWRKLNFKTCLEELRSAMKEVVQMRMGEPPSGFRGKRNERQWEKHWRNLIKQSDGKGKSTQRPSSSRGRSRGREEKRWRSPADEQYYGGDERQWQDPPRETLRHNPPKEQYRRGRDKSSRPKEQSGGGYKSRQPSPSRAKSRGGYKSRQPSPQKGVYESFLDRLPQEGRFPERVAGVFTDYYERRLTGDPPRGVLRGGLVGVVAGELGRQAADALGIRQRSPSHSPPRGKSKVRVADPATGYGGGGSSSSRKRHGSRQYMENHWKGHHLDQHF